MTMWERFGPMALVLTSLAMILLGVAGGIDESLGIRSWNREAGGVLAAVAVLFLILAAGLVRGRPRLPPPPN